MWNINTPEMFSRLSTKPSPLQPLNFRIAARLVLPDSSTAAVRRKAVPAAG
jgi:hypothetical protein